jgi:hypothetical protein
MKNHLAIVLAGFAAFSAFAGGQTDSGRDSGLNTIEAGKFAAPGAIDAYAYINDYVFPYEARVNDDLSIFVKLEKERILTIGDKFNLLIGLQVNGKDFFKRGEGNYIVFIHNPEILLRSEWKNSFASVLGKIRRAQETDAVLGLFDPAKEVIALRGLILFNRPKGRGIKPLRHE